MPRALLIGSSYGGLHVEPSVDSVYQWLRDRGFGEADIQRLTGARATRDEILAALAALADEDHGDAAVIVYYAGHGHLYRSEIGAGEGGHAAYPLLVAIDIDTSTDGTLHSVLGSELSRALRSIARRARNLTVILDCCHASGMIRLDDEDSEHVHTTELALGAEASARIAQRRATITRSATIVPPVRLSEHVVVVAASSAGGRAYPHPSTERMVFTDALLAALDKHPTWDAVLAETRACVQEIWPLQVPAVFGPRFRRPLTLIEHLPPNDLYQVERRGEQTVLLTGPLADIHPGDEFELTTLASSTYGPDSILGRAGPYPVQPDPTVVRVCTNVRILPRPCYARRVERGRRRAIALECPDPGLRNELADLVVAANLRVDNDDPAPAARLALHDGMLRVSDCLGELVHLARAAPLPGDDLRRCLRRLDMWCGTSKWMLGDSSAQPLRRCYELRWGRANDSAGLAASALVVQPGASLALSLRNLDRGEPELYAQALRIRADREVRAWNPETGAHSIVARQCMPAGQQQEDGTRTFTLDAPLPLPPGRYREWTLVAVSNRPFDVHLLETPLNVRALTTGFSRSCGQTTRSDKDPRCFEILAMPYTLELPV